MMLHTDRTTIAPKQQSYVWSCQKACNQSTRPCKPALLKSNTSAKYVKQATPKLHRSHKHKPAPEPCASPQAAVREFSSMAAKDGQVVRTRLKHHLKIWLSSSVHILLCTPWPLNFKPSVVTQAEQLDRNTLCICAVHGVNVPACENNVFSFLLPLCRHCTFSTLIAAYI